MRLCSYTVMFDTGCVPNPFYGCCTLALCTPNHQGVRLDHGDWGLFFLRNSEWSMDFLKKWASLGRRYDSHPSAEQSALVHLLYREPKDKWKCVGQPAFNSYLYELLAF